MAYIGAQPALGNFVKLDAIVTSATATYNLLINIIYQLNHNENCINSRKE